MLASLLPGLRDLRTPLATGYLWLVALWLLVHQYVPKSVFDASGPIRSLYQLGALAGTTACFAAVSFVAYLVGSMLSFYPRQYILGLVQPRPDPNMRRSNFTRVFNYGRRHILSIQLGYELYYQLETFVSPKLREASETLSEDQLGYLVPVVAGWGLWGVRSDARLEARYAYSILQELSAVGTQLQAKNRDLWDTYDRQTSEAQFRFGISPPFLLIVVVLAWESHRYWWLLLFILPIALILQGVRQTVSAAAALVQAVVLRMVEPPVLERVREQTAKKHEDEQRRADERRAAEEHRRLTQEARDEETVRRREAATQKEEERRATQSPN